MKFSENWLRERVPELPGTPRLTERLTLGGIEVAGTAPAAPAFAGIVAAEVVEALSPAPKDGPALWRVQAGAGQPLVAAGRVPGLQPGAFAACALPGALLPDGRRVTPDETGSEQAVALLCSGQELGLEEEDGLLHLPENCAPGDDLRTLLDLDDTVVELDLTPNRGDCLSMRGLAREIAALEGLSVREPEIAPVPPRCEEMLPVRLQASAACPLYAGRAIVDICPGVSAPAHIRERLRRAGIRSISAPVDIGNYVMLELGQPVHIFDLDTLNGGIRVRLGRAGETLALIDGSTAELSQEDLVIADRRGAIALAGIMGGAASAVTSATRRLFLESAWFSPMAVGGRARKHRLSSEAARRFERGVDPELPDLAMERMTELLLSCVGGQAGPITRAEVRRRLPKTPVIRLRRRRIEEVLGMPVADDAVEEMLRRLGMGLESTRYGWRVRPPGSRSDLCIEEDLLEELARLYGYDQLPVSRPSALCTFSFRSAKRAAPAEFRRCLAARGYREAISYSLADPKLQALLDPVHEPVPLENPISAEMSVLRTSLWPGLVQAMLHNQRHQEERVRLFEIGCCFLSGGEGGAPREESMLAVLASGPRLPRNWNNNKKNIDFFDLHGDIQAILELSGGGDWVVEAASHPALHPGQSARLCREDQLAGYLGMVHPALAAKLEMTQPTGLLEVQMESLSSLGTPQHREIVRQPALKRDLAVVVREDLPGAALMAEIRQAAGDCLESLLLFDIYRGEGVPAEHKSLAFHMLFRHPERAFGEAEASAILVGITSRLAECCGAHVRT